ncbi:MAG TPA: YihY/virulence factor BrkB family protein [Haliangiales bacterium]|nr:YihY/virulence factor BrkB family protein [Haliangiales bacterium]
MRRRRTFTQALRRLADTNGKTGLARHFANFLRVNVQVVRQWTHDHCPQQAAYLAFETALSLVPIMAVTLSLLRATGEFDAQSTLVSFLAREVLPVSRAEVSDKLLEWAGNLSGQAAGVFGVAVTLVLAFILYKSVEGIFNDIWRVVRRRTLGQRFVYFYAVATLVPALLAVSLYHAARFGLTTGASGWIIELAASFAALFVANKLLPALRVTVRAAAVGALVSAILFEASKAAFRFYVVHVALNRYTGVYGALGLLPVVLLWIWVSWLVVLLGAEVAHAVQNLDHLEQQELPDDERQIGPEPAARLLCHIIDRWRRGEGPVLRGDLVTSSGLPEKAVERNLHYLVTGGLVLAVDREMPAYLPARPPSEVRLRDVFALFRPETPPADRLSQALGELDEKTDITFEDLTG